MKTIYIDIESSRWIMVLIEPLFWKNIEILIAEIEIQIEFAELLQMLMNKQLFTTEHMLPFSGENCTLHLEEKIGEWIDELNSQEKE